MPDLPEHTPPSERASWHLDQAHAIYRIELANLRAENERLKRRVTTLETTAALGDHVEGSHGFLDDLVDKVSGVIRGTT